MSDPRSDVTGVGSHAAHYNDTRYLHFFKSSSVHICIAFAWSMDMLYSTFMCINQLGMHALSFYLPKIAIFVSINTGENVLYNKRPARFLTP